MELAADPGLVLTVYTAEPGFPTEEEFTLLASWPAGDVSSSHDAAADRA
jgi:hypothetical protein